MGLHHSSTPDILAIAPPGDYKDFFPLRTPEWEDIRVPVNAIKLSGTKPPGWTSWKGGEVLAFQDQGVEANEQRVTFLVQLPHGYQEGTDIVAHVHWVGEDVTAGDVVWQLTCSWANTNQAFPGESTYYAVASNNSALADAHTHSDFSPALDGNSKTVSSMLVCTLRRNSNNIADTFAGKDAYLTEVDFHFKMDTIGSQNEATK